jgi:Lar family restriction alleviation protein
VDGEVSASDHAVVLLPCPFCGSGDVFVERSPDGSADWVECDTCLAHGPIPKGLLPTDEEVARQWNARIAVKSESRWKQT